MTSLTWITEHIGPTEMWVDGRTWRDYQAQGFELVDYNPPPKGAEGYDSGRAKIRKPGSECEHTYSPEMCALHKQVCKAHSDSHDGLRYGPTWKRLHEAHELLFGEYRYHEDLMQVDAGNPPTLEAVKSRVVTAIRDIAERFGGDTRRRVLAWASDIERWNYEGRV